MRLKSNVSVSNLSKRSESPIKTEPKEEIKEAKYEDADSLGNHRISRN
jgi:hypothetical protein